MPLPNEREIVLARYQEDLSWLSQVELPVLVYNKGEGLNPEWNFTSACELPNEGREAHSYFTHIIDQYDCLAGVTFFLQADPFPHCPHLLEHLTDEVEVFEWLFPETLQCDPNGCPHHPGLPVGQIYEWLFHRPCPERLEFGPCGLFAVRRETIHRKSRAWFVRAFETCQRHAEYAWVMERLWKIVLTEDV
jgi:hypothetical protein